MRILLLLLRSLIVIAIVAAIGFFITREVMITVGVAQVREALSAARALRLTPGSVAMQCQPSALTDPTQAIVEQIQITFTSDTDFQLEIVCRTALRQPVVVNQYQLPPLVRKVDGTSGLIWGEGTTGITLEVLGRRRSIILDNLEAEFQNGFLPAGIGTGPMATCAGYGYSCCSPDSTVGQGLQTSLVTDCPRSCYAQCLSRPVVLSLNTQPFYDAETRTVSIGTGDQVTFHFVVDPGVGQTSEATLDFGDGSSPDVTSETTHSVTHTYTCTEASCDYLVKLQVVDSRGATSADTPVSRLIVRVGGS